MKPDQLSSRPGRPRQELLHSGDSSPPHPHVDARSGNLDLQTALRESLLAITGDDPGERFSESRGLFYSLRGYLADYPSLAGDFDTLWTLRELYRKPVDVPEWVHASGIAGAADAWIDHARDGQVRAICESAVAPESRAVPGE